MAALDYKWKIHFHSKKIPSEKEQVRAVLPRNCSIDVHFKGPKSPVLL